MKSRIFLTLVAAALLPAGPIGCGSAAVNSGGTGSGTSGNTGGGTGGSGSGTGGSTGSGSAGSGSGGNTGTASPAGPLSASNLNLIFLVSEDLNYQGPGDVNAATANLTNQGLDRSLEMAGFLESDVLGSNNATGIYALEPMTHLETAGNYPDMAGLWTVEQFALLNQVTLSTVAGSYASPAAEYSYPLNASYAAGSVPSGAAAPSPFCSTCQGIDFNDEGGDNEALVSAVIQANAPGYYVFSAPWETTSSLLAKIDSLKGYNLSLPSSYGGPNSIYAISITPSSATTSSTASFVTYDTGVEPAAAYPALPAAVPTSACTEQTPFSITVIAGTGGAQAPAGIDSNETVYMIRHAEAHPVGAWDDGNYVGAGQWRALGLPAALAGKIAPDEVYSIDPAQFIGGTENAAGDGNWSYVRPSLTVEPYAIANNLPYNLAANFEIFGSDQATAASGFFFTGGEFSGHKVLLAWEHGRIPEIVNALIGSYFPSGGIPSAPAWPDGDYDTVWTVTLDGQGNLSVNNASCEGIESSALPAAAPQF